jgi:GntR family transcriptional regulator
VAGKAVSIRPVRGVRGNSRASAQTTANSAAAGRAVIANTGGPLYSALRSDLLRRIRSGEFAVGEWLPSEADLQREYGMSQTPVRRALKELEQAGLIRRHQGRGSVVRGQEILAATRMIGLGSELRERGHQVGVKVIGTPKLVEPPPAAVQALGLAASEPAVHLMRVFEVDGTPSVLFEHYLSPAITLETGQLEAAPSLYTYLTERGAAPSWAHEEIRAGLLTTAQGALLGRPAGCPVLIRERTAYGKDDQAIEYATYWICAEGYSVALHLQSTFT